LAKIRISRFLQQFALTTVISLLTTVTMIFITKFLARGLGPEEFGAYSLARRMISNIAPLLILSTEVALSRFIAMSKDPKTQSAYLLAAIIITGSAGLLFLAGALGGGRTFTTFVFGSPKYEALYKASLVLLEGYVLAVLVYSSLLGRQAIKAANAFQFLVMGLLPLSVAYFFATPKNLSLLVLLMGLAFYVSVGPIVFLLGKCGFPSWAVLKTSIKDVFTYSLPRVPAGFFLAGILTIGPFLAGKLMGLKESGFFVVGQSILRIMESFIVAFGLIALPKISQWISEGKEEYLQLKIKDLLALIFHLGLFLTIQTFIWSKEIILIWLGPEYMGIVPVMKIILLSLAPYIAYVFLRSIVDAVDVRAINMLNLFFSLLVTMAASLGLYYAGAGILGLALGTTIGFVALGLLTTRYLYRRYHFPLNDFRVLLVAGLNVLFAGAALLAKPFLTASSSQIGLLGTALALEILFFAGYIFVLFQSKTPWLLELRKRVVMESS